MNRILYFVAFAIISLAVLPPAANAQHVSSAAFEGHVFDAKTLRPLENAVIVYEFTVAGGLGGGFSASTNPGGFYQLEITPPSQPLASVGFSALCRTRKGDVVASGIIYDLLRTDVYRRDFYITLPKGITKCTP